ncbi:hypothetical protein V1264_011582 [Littorina saxatilis]|uniref:Uncharacterized protein n=1 Tax=Littorina saxatilis TaxID=31220 RepID=A0AAN9BUK3_9CAEN
MHIRASVTLHRFRGLLRLVPGYWSVFSGWFVFNGCSVFHVQMTLLAQGHPVFNDHAATKQYTAMFLWWPVKCDEELSALRFAFISRLLALCMMCGGSRNTTPCIYDRQWNGKVCQPETPSLTFTFNSRSELSMICGFRRTTSGTHGGHINECKVGSFLKKW